MFPTLALATVVPVILLAGAASALDAQPALSAGEFGRIIGSVEISSALTARRPQFRIYSDPGPGSVPAAPPRNELAAELRNVVVYLDGERDAPRPILPAASDSARVMSQVGERFEPHVLPVLQGARVDFPNHDALYHNVFSLSRARTFDLGRYPKGTSKSVSFPRRGVVQVFCHIHADMSGLILVLPNAFFAAPDTSGRFRIDDVPPGEYTIVGWHERTRPVSHRVRVVAGQSTTINFQLPLGPRPGQ